MRNVRQILRVDILPTHVILCYFRVLMELPETESLQNCRLFEGLSHDDVRALFGMFEIQRYPKGTILFREGDLSRNIFVVVEGRLGVRKHIIDKKDDNIPLLPVIAEHGPGETVGEFSFYDKNPRSAEVYAMADTCVMVLSPETFEHFSDTSPKLSHAVTVNILRILIHRMRRTNEQLSIALEWGWEAHGFVK